MKTRIPLQLLTAALLLPTLVLPGCNDYPVHSLLDSFSARVTSNLSNSNKVKLDFLWVIDHSPSMCKQQQDLAKAFNGFVADLQALGQVDAQMAVVTVQQIADLPSSTGVTVKKIGKFNTTPATSFPPNCIEHWRAPCFADNPGDTTATSAQCRDQFDFTFKAGVSYQPPPTSLCPFVDGKAPPYGDGTKTYVNPLGGKHDEAADNMWRCKSPASKSLVTNDNGSVNSYCWRHCKEDAECKKLLNDDSAICYSPGGPSGADQAGCMFPPATKDCGNKELAPVLSNDKLEQFHCIATVGASSTQQSGFEGGLRSAWMAIDPAGPNCVGGPKVTDSTGKVVLDAEGKSSPNPNCQYAQLVRDDAYLVIVFVSDDDDCSVDLSLSLANETDDEKKALKQLLTLDDQNMCQRLGDAVGGNRRLNEGNCMYVKSKQTNPANYKCPVDCKADDAACLAEAEKNVQANRSVDKRFAPVSDFVNRFKSLKSDPAHVIVAAISGDSAAQAYKDGLPLFDSNGGSVADELQKVIDTDMYFKAARRNIAPGQSPYVCAGKKGESGYGSRYIELANAFRENGIFANICDGDFSGALSGISETILKRIIKICLPYPPKFVDGAPQLEVKRVRGTDETLLAYTAETTDKSAGKYYIQSSPDCRAGKTQVTGESQPCSSIRDCANGLVCTDGLCKVYSDAIYFTEVPNKGDNIEINYGADLGFSRSTGDAGP